MQVQQTVVDDSLESRMLAACWGSAIPQVIAVQGMCGVLWSSCRWRCIEGSHDGSPRGSEILWRPSGPVAGSACRGLITNIHTLPDMTAELRLAACFCCIQLGENFSKTQGELHPACVQLTHFFHFWDFHAGSPSLHLTCCRMQVGKCTFFCQLLPLTKMHRNSSGLSAIMFVGIVIMYLMFSLCSAMYVARILLIWVELSLGTCNVDAAILGATCFTDFLRFCRSYWFWRFCKLLVFSRSLSMSLLRLPGSPCLSRGAAWRQRFLNLVLDFFFDFVRNIDVCEEPSCMQCTL